MSARTEIRIEMLGGFTLLRCGSPVVLPTRKAMALLAILASRPGVAFSRERLAELLWARSAPAQARGSLRQAITQVRKSLRGEGSEPIEADTECVRLVPGLVAIDVSEMECALAEGSPEGVQRAAALYVGDLLEGFSLPGTLFEQWRELEARRVRHDAAACLLRSSRVLDENSALEAARVLAERLQTHTTAPATTCGELLRLVRGTASHIH